MGNMTMHLNLLISFLFQISEGKKDSRNSDLDGNKTHGKTKMLYKNT